MDITPVYLMLCIVAVVWSADDTLKHRKSRRMFKRNINCDYKKNKYYEPQINSCLRCDKCIVGKGQVDRKEFDLKFDLKHGALNCLPCRPCPDSTFNKFRAYTCKPCKNCTQLGLVELKPCSTSSNAVCGDAIPEPITYVVKDQSGQINVSPKGKPPLQSQGIIDFSTGPVPSTAIFAVIGVLVVTALSGTSFVYYKHKRKNGMNVLSDASIATASADEDGKTVDEKPFLPLNNTAKIESHVIESPDRTDHTHQTTPKTTSTQWVTHLEDTATVSTTLPLQSQSDNKYLCFNELDCKHHFTSKTDYNVCIKELPPLSSSPCRQCSKTNHMESLNVMSDFQYELQTVVAGCNGKEAYV